MQQQTSSALLLIPLGLFILWIYGLLKSLSKIDLILAALLFGILLLIFFVVFFRYFSKWGKENQKRIDLIHELPSELLVSSENSIFLGIDADLDERIFLPDPIRTRHVHLLGATGSGKTESVILNFLRQDILRGLGSIVLDAKGDASFLHELTNWVPKQRLKIFDLMDENSLGYDPLTLGSPLESAQRLFSSLTWSEEYYKSKALSSLQRIFQKFAELNDKNPTLIDVSAILETPDSYSSFVNSIDLPQNIANKDFQDLSGLRDQVRSLTLGHLKKILSPNAKAGVDISKAEQGDVIYFRLQSLMSPQIVAIMGKLVINHLNFLAGTAHRERIDESGQAKSRKLVPVYLDEFATFACPEFADLISKARSAKFALHFSHQSIGDVVEVSQGFLSRITDNAATKIVMRVNDPESAEFLSRCFGTKDIQKTTQRITNTKDIESAEVVGEGTSRDAHQFRASPDLLKTLPTGMGAVLIAHGQETPHGASSVFKIKFPELRRPL